MTRAARSDNHYPKVRNLIFNRGPLTREQVEQLLKISSSVAKKHLLALHRDGAIHIARWDADTNGRNQVPVWGHGVAPDAARLRGTAVVRCEVDADAPRGKLMLWQRILPLHLPGTASEVSERSGQTAQSVRRCIDRAKSAVHIARWQWDERLKRWLAVYAWGSGEDATRPQGAPRTLVVKQPGRPLPPRVFVPATTALPIPAGALRSVFVGGSNPWAVAMGCVNP